MGITGFLDLFQRRLAVAVTGKRDEGSVEVCGENSRHNLRIWLECFHKKCIYSSNRMKPTQNKKNGNADDAERTEPVCPAGPVPLLIFGEVLFDVFPDGHRVLGGAPFNVGWGLKGFGQDPLLVSAVGMDTEGQTIRDRMMAWNLRTEGLQTVQPYRTGAVHVALNHGEPSYDICMPRAWDSIHDEGFSATRLLYHGLLALRSETSRRTFESIQSRSEAVRFFDVNLRPPHDSRDLLEQWMQGADWLKLNLDELAVVLGGKPVSFIQITEPIEQLRSTYGIRNVLLTAGSQGLRIQGEVGEAVYSPAHPVAYMADTVGAGDAISAAVIHGIMQGMPVQDIVNAASRFASTVCSIHGATIQNQEFYKYE
ncbi:MAG: carbohydrate kinase [Spartobacteria bacterium]|nr:carbohydrate kinase [Spartobacteria bacterium]